MKKILKSLLFIALLILPLAALKAQGPPQPPENPGTGGGPVGGAAPIGEGIGLMIGLGVAYAGWKRFRKVKECTYFEEIEE
jgi:hypothetical protein